jgi:hypothetical protein
MDVDPESAEWTIAWSLKQHARTLLGPKADRVSAHLIAMQSTGDLRRSSWRLIKNPPELAAPGGPEAMREAILRRRQEREAFEDLLSALLSAWHAHFDFNAGRKQ